LVIFSHVIEHVPDALPILRAIRRCLVPEGILFVGTPNVLLPPTHGLERNFMAGPHVCLYSPRSIRRILAKAGFAVAEQDNWYPRGLRVTARPTAEAYQPGLQAADDWKVIAHLYDGLTRGPAAGCFARNVAALVPHDFHVLEEISKKVSPGRPRLHRVNGQIVNMEVALPTGFVPLLDPEPPHTVDGRITENGTDIAEGSLVVLIGLGLGDHALSLLPLLDRLHARRVIYEPEASVVRTAFAVRDLTSLLRSKRVRLCVGPGVKMTGTTREWFRAAEAITWRADPMMDKTLYRIRYEPARRTFERWCQQFQGVAA
jgi:SAM-dependent methyltransferase